MLYRLIDRPHDPGDAADLSTMGYRNLLFSKCLKPCQYRKDDLESNENQRLVNQPVQLLKDLVNVAEDF
jgi:hypothetical protein